MQAATGVRATGHVHLLSLLFVASLILDWRAATVRSPEAGAGWVSADASGSMTAIWATFTVLDSL